MLNEEMGRANFEQLKIPNQGHRAKPGEHQTTNKVNGLRSREKYCAGRLLSGVISNALMSLKTRYRLDKDRPATLLDRFGMAALSAILAFLSALAVWAVLAIGRSGGGLVLPLEYILWFTAVMTVLGFLMAESLLVTIFGQLWYALYVLLTDDRPSK